LHVAIARNVAGLIEDGAVLQTGIGGIPDAVLPFLGDRKDLAVHSELVSDGVIPLIEAGVITGARKNFKPRKIILGFALGSKNLFDFVDNNPIFEFHPTAYTNDPALIARNDNMVAINSALQIDLTGQVCSDSVGTHFYSGIGGQVDFLRGASRSKGGKPIIAISSTAKNGKISRIVPMLSPGAGVVTSRGLIRYVVTEYGVAYLHGKTIRERAQALIEIAHPSFREELYEYCEKTKWLYRPLQRPKSKSHGFATTNQSHARQMICARLQHFYELNIFFSAAGLRMIRVAPFNCTSCFFLNCENKRLTVSRVVPMISAISSCVSVSFTCTGSPFGNSPLHDSLHQPNSNFANLSEGELLSPSVRIPSYAV
jgi:acyl-CoA hydrolase